MLCDPSIVYLFDPCGKNAVEPTKVYANTWIASSPNKANYQQFDKRPNTYRLYVPTWSLDELLTIDSADDQVPKIATAPLHKWEGDLEDRNVVIIFFRRNQTYACSTSERYDQIEPAASQAIVRTNMIGILQTLK